jgi:uncharacterized protein
MTIQTTRTIAATIVAGFTVALLAGALPAQAQLKRITVGTNPAGTMYNTLGGGFAKMLQEKLGIPGAARPFSGSSVYIPMLHRGEITLGINSSNDSSVAYHGKAPYKQRMKNLRALMAVWPLPYQYWAKASSGIKTIGDLRGKRVVVTYKANASLAQLNRAILATAGLTENDVTAITVAGIPQSLRAVTEGRADAAAIALGIAPLRKAHASIPGGIRILEMGPDEAAVARGRPGSWVTTTKPGKRNVGVDKPIRIAMFHTYLNAGTKLSDDDAYLIVKTLHQNWAALQKDYPVLRRTPADKVVPSDAPHPYHAGAIRYFKEVGLWTAAHEANQAKQLK